MLILILSYILPILFWLWIIRKFDRFEPEPIKTILFVFVLGGLISVIPAGFINELLKSGMNDNHPAGFTDAVIAGRSVLRLILSALNEEVLKAFATVLLIRKMKQFNEPADALVYAMTVALGFGILESIEYALKYGHILYFIRQLNAVPLHMGLAGIWGIGIARVKFLHRGSYFITLIPYLLLATGIHASYNFFVINITNPWLTLGIPSVIWIILILLAVRRIRRYAEDGPFSRRLYCHHCHAVNYPVLTSCLKCGRPLEQEFYQVCRLCAIRVLKDEPVCPVCHRYLAVKE